MKINHLLLIDIDGLRPDVFATALKQAHIPHLAELLGGPEMRTGLQIPALAPAPSITFCSQASLFSGTHPAQHGIPGNQFFDRFGAHSKGKPRHYAFDVGDTLAADDAVRVFTDGLAMRCLQAPTIYERLAERGWRSLVAGSMYARGAETWIKPALADIARFTKGGDLFGLLAHEYDNRILEKTVAHLSKNGMPNVLTIHFLGLDHESHAHGPGAQMGYLVDYIDPMVGKLWDAVSLQAEPGTVLVAIFSDHGQVEVYPDDRHSLRLAFPFEREMGHLFDALGLDVHDYPGEDPACDAVVASNGGTAHVYLRNRRGDWNQVPDFKRDVLPVGRAFWQAHATGRYAAELEGALSGVMIRDSAGDGWDAPYRALTPGGEIVSLQRWFSSQPDGLYVDPVQRLNNLASPMSGDLLLISNYAEGFYFGAPTRGVHGGLHPQDSGATLVYGFPQVGKSDAETLRARVRHAIQSRCQSEGDRQPSTADLCIGLQVTLE
jgi:hypothetical protein